jgi:hypothetical protein
MVDPSGLYTGLVSLASLSVVYLREFVVAALAGEVDPFAVRRPFRRGVFAGCIRKLLLNQINAFRFDDATADAILRNGDCVRNVLGPTCRWKYGFVNPESLLMSPRHGRICG